MVDNIPCKHQQAPCCDLARRWLICRHSCKTHNSMHRDCVGFWAAERLHVLAPNNVPWHVSGHASQGSPAWPPTYAETAQPFTFLADRLPIFCTCLPAGSFCKAFSRQPKDCPWLATCSEGSVSADLSLGGFLGLAIILILLWLIYLIVLSYIRCSFTHCLGLLCL